MNSRNSSSPITIRICPSVKAADIILILFISIFDQWIKTGIRSMQLGSVLYSAPGLFEITHQINTGVAFSALSEYPAVVVVLSLLLMVLLVICILRFLNPTPLAYLLFCVMLGGGLGNLIDRVVFGGVTDYIRVLFISFPVFNFADICVTGSAFLLALLLLMGRLESKALEN